jgi:hypothetical protein
VDWKQGGPGGTYLIDNPASLRFQNAFPSGPTGYLFYTGREMYRATHSNINTHIRRFDPRELIATELIAGSDRNETGTSNGQPYIRMAANSLYNGWSLSPHDSPEAGLHVAHRQPAHQVLADGSVQSFLAKNAIRTVALQTVNGAWATRAGKADQYYYRALE